jgi:transmembrane sensor
MKINKVNHQILEEASTWFVDFRVGDVDARARDEFRRWLQRSPEHIQAYIEIATTYAELPAASIPRKSATDEAFDVDALIARARTGSDANIVPIESAAVRTGHRNREDRRRMPVAVAIAIAAICASTWFYLQRGTYSTVIGEQRSLILEDGSTVELNSNSEIRVRYAESERHIDLVEGQAQFHVAKNKARPFIVRSGDTQVRAVGTQFDVYRRTSGTTVTVIEGQVALEGASTASLEVLLSAGEQAVVTHEVIEKPAKANITAATAWTARRLVFDATPLSEVAEEFNRYNRRQLIVDEAQLADFHVSGTYSTTNPDSLLRFLRAQPGIKVVESEREIHVSKE